MGSVNVVQSRPDSSLLHALLGRNFLGHPHDDGPYLALPSSFLQIQPEAHQTHQKRVALILNRPQNPCDLHPMMIVHVFSSLPHLAFVHPHVERRMAETHQSILTHHSLKPIYHCSMMCNIIRTALMKSLFFGTVIDITNLIIFSTAITVLCEVSVHLGRGTAVIGA
jgi:hypothetical protein